jgi:hypothetical protein
MDWFNTYVKRDMSVDYYCPPSTIAFTPDQYINMLERYLKKEPGMGKMPLGLALLETLKSTLPCKK